MQAGDQILEKTCSCHSQQINIFFATHENISMLYSFPPLARDNAHTLILGSMPGKASLAAKRYYAHSRNVFWPIIEKLLDIPATCDYEARAEQLIEHGFAVWDVIGSCNRASSLDSAIENDSIKVNDFALFFEKHSEISRIFFNGLKAEQTYQQHVLKKHPHLRGKMYRRLPSTSPANARMNFSEKLSAWAVLTDTDFFRLSPV